MDIKPFTRKEKIIVFFACALGWAHDAIGLTLITFLVGPIATEFNIIHFPVPIVPEFHIGIILSAQYIATVPGAFLFGALADKYGRKNLLLASIAWDAILTAASAFAPNFYVFATLRILSGMGVSWGIAFALLGEVYSPKRRAFFGGLVHAMFIIGYLGSAISVLVLEPVLSVMFPVVWWRYLFLIALIPIPFVIWLYFALPESRLWEKYHELESPDKLPIGTQLREIIRKGYLKFLVIATLIFWAAEFAYHAFVDWGPWFLGAGGIGLPGMQPTLIVMGIALLLLIVFPLVGLLGDFIGRRRAFMVPAILGILGTLVFAVAVLLFLPPPVLITILGLVILALGFSSHGLFGVWSSEIFPTRARAAANSIIFSVARGVSLGAVTVGTLVLILGIPLGQAMLIGSLGFVLMLLLPWLLPETKGKVLKPD
ncbi:MAG: MFS transporter [Candidatus Hodarchaeota archaeon]